MSTGTSLSANPVGLKVKCVSAINQDVCRGCLAVENLRPLTKEIATVLSDFLNKNNFLGDGLPQRLCAMCTALIKKFYHFRARCERSRLILVQNYMLQHPTSNEIYTGCTYTLTKTAIENTSYVAVKVPRNSPFKSLFTPPQNKSTLHYDTVPKTKLHTVSTQIAQSEYIKPSRPSRKKILPIAAFSKPNTAWNPNQHTGNYEHQVSPFDSLAISTKLKPSDEVLNQLHADKRKIHTKTMPKKKVMEIKKRREEWEAVRDDPDDVEHSDSDTLTAPSAPTSDLEDPPDSTSPTDTVHNDHTYDEQPKKTFRSSRLNEKRKLNRNDNFVYPSVEKGYRKTKLFTPKKNNKSYWRFVDYTGPNESNINENNCNRKEQQSNINESNCNRNEQQSNINESNCNKNEQQNNINENYCNTNEQQRHMNDQNTENDVVTDDFNTNDEVAPDVDQILKNYLRREVKAENHDDDSDPFFDIDHIDIKDDPDEDLKPEIENLFVKT